MTTKTEVLKLSKCVLSSFDRRRIFIFVFLFFNDKLARVINRNIFFSLVKITDDGRDAVMRCYTRANNADKNKE